MKKTIIVFCLSLLFFNSYSQITVYYHGPYGYSLDVQKTLNSLNYFSSKSEDIIKEQVNGLTDDEFEWVANTHRKYIKSLRNVFMELVDKNKVRISCGEGFHDYNKIRIATDRYYNVELYITEREILLKNDNKKIHFYCSLEWSNRNKSAFISTDDLQYAPYFSYTSKQKGIDSYYYSLKQFRNEFINY